MARVKKAVVDASVVVKWFNQENYTEDALRLRSDYADRRIDLVAPYFLLYEVGNALRYNPDFGVEDVQSAIMDLLKIQIDLRLLDEEQIKLASSLAYNLGVTLYDAAYLAIASREGVRLITADERLVAKVGPKLAMHVKDY
ncbi:MAG: type II toxin-antitoxin system VapC family toxin [Nitrososphaerota archaeon]|nr:type II toxin-antitoxin system VapC family toxin [Candidatus Calditenuaceae archaeon]MDW8074029.1 type II toxin-antitoxin system VapC family toxin [Nitrososphaerota archaeon]